MKTRHLQRALRSAALFIWMLAPWPALACAACGCSLSGDAIDASSGPGWSISLQTDVNNQNQYRHGSGTIAASAVAAVPGQEVEHQTLNRTTTLGLAYAPDADWSLRLQLPYVDRSHTTYGPNPSLPLTPDQLSGATVSGLGDARVIATWSGLLPTHALGLQLGLKLPTGRDSGANFGSGPSAGQALDTSLQAGTGSTDLIVGAFVTQALSQNWDGYAGAQFQAAVAHRLDQPGLDYRPGNQSSVNFGLRYEADPRWTPQLQLNLVHKNADQGALAAPTAEAGTIVTLSPGISVALGDSNRLYGFLQLPVWSQLDGYQLLPRWSASVGISHAF